MAWRALAVAAVSLAALAGCQRGADTGATPNPNAPGRPGSGNAARTVTPVQGDGPPGGSSGVAGSAAHPGASGGDAVPGLTGSGAADPNAKSAQNGSPLSGGLGGNEGSIGMGAPAAPSQGSTNRTPAGSVGNR